MKSSCVVTVLALVAVALPSAENGACPPPESRVALVPVPDEPKEPTLAPPEPAKQIASGQILVVRVDGEVPAPGEPLSALVPIPEPQGEPTAAPPGCRASGSGPQTILVQVDGEQVAGNAPPAHGSCSELPGLAVP